MNETNTENLTAQKTEQEAEQNKRQKTRVEHLGNALILIGIVVTFAQFWGSFSVSNLNGILDFIVQSAAHSGSLLLISVGIIIKNIGRINNDDSIVTISELPSYFAIASIPLLLLWMAIDYLPLAPIPKQHATTITNTVISSSVPRNKIIYFGETPDGVKVTQTCPQFTSTILMKIKCETTACEFRYSRKAMIKHYTSWSDVTKVIVELIGDQKQISDDQI
jgi:hypothetical protein